MGGPVPRALPALRVPSAAPATCPSRPVLTASEEAHGPCGCDHTNPPGGMTGSKDPQGNLPAQSHGRRRSRYKRKKKKKCFKEETAPERRITRGKKEVGNPVQTWLDSGSPFLELPEHPAYHGSCHRPGPAGHGALPSPTATGYSKPQERAAASASGPGARQTGPTLSPR